MDALIVVDVQNDFLPGGALAVPGGDEVVPVINRLMQSIRFGMIIATQDWHPSNHRSFAENTPGRKVGERIELDGLQQILWPTHCVQNSNGAQFASALDTAKFAQIVRKGTQPTIDSYSGFFDNGRRSQTELDQILRKAGAKRIYVTGLALDYCVKFTALDSISLGYSTFVITDATRAVNLQPEDDSRALAEMRQRGIGLLTVTEFLR